MSKEKTPVSEYKPLMLRLPEDVLQALSLLAHANHRSKNAQIVHVLTEWIAQERARASHHDDTPAPQPALAATGR